MVVDTQLYDLLGVSPDVSERDLKKAFMKKARELHPDKNRDDPKATEKFQAVNEAYEVLKDAEKRRMYDQYGVDGMKRSDSHFNDIFSNIFNFGPRSTANRRSRTQDCVYPVNATLEDLYNGKEVTLKITRNIICAHCQGNGTESGKPCPKCSDCNGTGQKVITTQRGPMISQQITTCSKCNGTGESPSAGDSCKKCKGKKVVEEEKRIKVQIERGMEDGEKIKFQGLADEYPNWETGDLIIVIKQKKNDKFIRNYADLLYKKKITLSEALLGTKIVINHLDDRKLVVTCPPTEIITPGCVKLVEKEGMPKRGNQYEKGNLYVAFEIEFPRPNQITPALREALASALPLPDETAGLNMSDDNVVKVKMNPATIQEFQNAKSSQSRDDRKEAYDSAEDERQQGGASCQPM